MGKGRSYRNFERFMTGLVLGGAVVFVLFLIVSALGIGWLKAITAIVAILLSILSLGYLYLSRELLRQRSLWISASFAAILVCTLVSLLLRYPGPAL